MKTIMLAAFLALASIEAQAEFLFGNDLVQYMRQTDEADAGNSQASYYDVGNYMGFVAGVFDAYLAAGLICPSPDVTRGQAKAIVSSYLKSNPDKWDLSAVSLVRNAFVSAFPCH